MKIISSFFLLILLTLFLRGDEIKLSYLEIKQKSAEEYAVLLKVPAKDNSKLPIGLTLPDSCDVPEVKISTRLKQAYLDTWKMQCKGGLVGQTFDFKGLKHTGTDALFRIELLNGVSQSKLLTPSISSYSIPKEESSLEIVQTYSWLGITHILLGYDHLLFVFALLLIVKNMRRLLWTVTAFTLAHSLTMVVATLGIVSLPQAPVEAIIALSILFLAMEIIHEKQGKIGMTSRFPWIIAFIFGLLHGFGFAGALAEIGLPQHAIALALIFFNIGVELGQLMFVITIVFTVTMLQKLTYKKFLDQSQTIVVYSIGGVSAFWLIERTLSF